MRIALFLIVFSLAFCPSYSQSIGTDNCSNFRVKIKLINQKYDSIGVVYSDCDDSNSRQGIFFLKHGVCYLTGRINRATDVLLFTDINDPMRDGPKVVRFIIQPGNQTMAVRITNGFISSIRSTGSSAEEEKIAWDKLNKKVEAEEDKYSREAHKLNADLRQRPGDSTALNPIINELYQKISNCRLVVRRRAMQYAINTPTSYFSGYLVDRFKRALSTDSSIEIFNSLSDSVKKSDFGSRFITEMVKIRSDSAFLKTYLSDSQYEKLERIHSIYDFSLSKYDGGLFDFEKLRGKYVILDTWASWCGFCHQNVLPMRDIANKFKGKNIEFVSVCIDDKATSWRLSVNKYGYPGINVWDGEKLFSIFFKVTALPRFILIGPSGKIICESAPQALDGQLEKYLEGIL